MSENFLSEAFKDLEIVTDGTFDFSDKGAEELKAYLDGDNMDDFETIVDSEAEKEEDLKDSYLGDVILSCNICHGLMYKKPEEIVVDEVSEDVNCEEECPYCSSIDGYKIVGQVAEYEPEEHHHDEESEEREETEIKIDGEEIKDEEELEECNKPMNERLFLSKKKAITESSERDDIDADADDKKEKAEKDLEKEKDDADSDKDYKLKKAGMKEPEQLKEESNTAKLKKAFPELDLEEKLEESDKPAAISIEDAQKWVDFDMKHYGKISERTNELVKKAGFQIIKDDHDDYEVIAGKFESLDEDFQKVEIETDTEKMSMTADEDSKTTVTTEPKKCEECEEKAEIITPVSDEVKAEIEDKEEVEEEPTFEDEEEVDIDEFDEESFDELGESYLKKVYDNVDSYKTTAAKVSGNKLMLEGLIKFTSGKQAKTNFLFEASHKTVKGKLKFKGSNKQITESRNSFIITGSVNNKKLLSEALTYNYKVKGNKDRVYGTIKK